MIKIRYLKNIVSIKIEIKKGQFQRARFELIDISVKLTYIGWFYGYEVSCDKKLSSHYYLDYSSTQFLNSDFSKIHLFRSLTSKSTESNEIIVQTYSLCYNVGCQTDFFWAVWLAKSSGKNEGKPQSRFNPVFNQSATLGLTRVVKELFSTAQSKYLHIFIYGGFKAYRRMGYRE